MDPRALLQQLMDRDGLNSNSLAARLENATTQPQIHKFLAGKAREPRRSTLAPVARYFRIPLDALYDANLADLAAKQKQLPGAETKTNHPLINTEPAQLAITREATGKLSQMALDLALAFDEELHGRVERSQAYIKMMAVVTSIVDGRGALPSVEPAQVPKKQHG